MHTYERALEQAKDFLLEYDDFLIVSHIQPDGDAVSSTLTVGWLLSCLGKKFTMLNEGTIPQRMQFLWNADTIVNMSLRPLERKYSQVICVDCASFHRLGLTTQYVADDALILNIDHHPTNDGYGSINIIKPDAAATAEILFDLLELCNVNWDVDVASLIYTGLLTDTGGFRYSNTSSKVMSIASKLLSYGVNGPELSECLLECMSLAQVQILVRALSTLQMSEDGKIAWVTIRPEDMVTVGAENEDMEGIVNYPRNIQGVEVGILFKVIDGRAVKASLRSAGNVDVAALAYSFGGGGHVRAAGCSVAGSLEEVVERVVSKVKERL